jgi:ribonuclease D
MNVKIILVNTPQKLARAVDDITRADVLSIDTEYDSFRYFKEKLCLIQIHASKTTYIFDPLGDIDLSFFTKVFRDRKTLKILHAADNDIRLLKRDYSFDFENIFDTHRAALILGFKQLSLEKMIAQFVGVELEKNKKMQRSRWDNRPLTDEQLIYAAQDVTYLPALYKAQLAKLRETNLEEAALEAFSKIASCNWQEKRIDHRGHMKINGYYSLNQKQKEILKKLYGWRFRRAKEENRAIFMFMPDKTMLDLVQDPQNVREYLKPEKAEKYGLELEHIIKND